MANRYRKNRGSSYRRRRVRRNIATLVIFVLLIACAVIFLMMPDGPLGALTRGGTASPTATPAQDVIPEPTETPAVDDSVTSVPPTPEPEITAEPTPTPEPTPEPTPVELALPYYIVVDRGAQIVTVYTVGETGEFDLPVRTMICSTDQYNRKPTNGIYKMDGEKKRWLTTLVSGSYAQYATRITSKILFHSVPYTGKKPNTLDAKAYKLLGTNASIGCVRLLCADAKWIYDNIEPGTPCAFVTGEYSAERLAELAVPDLVSEKWDPTDPDEKNPAYDASYVKPEVTPWLGVTPAPTPKWTPTKYS